MIFDLLEVYLVRMIHAFRDEVLLGQHSDKRHGLATAMQDRWYDDKGHKDGLNG